MKIMKNQLISNQIQEKHHKYNEYSRLDYFIKVMQKTCQYLKGVKLVPKEPGHAYAIAPIFKYGNDDMSLSYRYYPKRVIDTTLVGIDSSIHPIAESKNGYVFALQGAIILHSIKGNKIFRFGPILSYISKDTMHIINDIPNCHILYSKQYSLNPTIIKKFLIDLFEYTLLHEAISLSQKRSIITVDGTLTRFIKYTYIFGDSLFKRIVERGIYITGISKKSRLFKLFPHITTEVIKSELPIVIRIQDSIFRRLQLHNIHIYLGKFSKCGIPLRIDILYTNNSYTCVFDNLYTIAYAATGYPNVLRDAHITAKISKAELIGLRLYLERLGAQILPSFRIRDILFGVYNKK